MIKCLVRLIQTDLMLNETKELSKGQGSFEDGVLIYCENEDPSIRHEITFEKDHVLLKRFADTLSETDLRLEEKSIARVISSYGTMMLETYMTQFSKQEDYWMIEYQILQEDEVVTYQRLEWYLEGFEDC